jgi:hypothetical protein
VDIGAFGHLFSREDGRAGTFTRRAGRIAG